MQASFPPPPKSFFKFQPSIIFQVTNKKIFTSNSDAIPKFYNILYYQESVKKKKMRVE